MGNDKGNDAGIRVVAVCGNEAAVYGPVQGGARPLIQRYTFSTRGAALEFAADYEDRERGQRNKRTALVRAEAA